MKQILIFLTIFTLSFSAQSYAEGWLDSLKNMLGLGQETQQAEAPNANELVKTLTRNLGINKKQAVGGMGALMNYVKSNISEEQFAQLSAALPGIEGLLKAVPDIDHLEESGGLSGLLDKAAEYSDSLKSVNNVKKQFEALGLKPEMIMQYVEQMNQYLDSEQGKEAKALIQKSLNGLLG